MASLRQGIEKASFQTQPSTKVLAVAAKFGLQPPISLLRVASLLKPEELNWDTGSVKSGDDELVTASAHLWLASTGFWKFTGEVHDSAKEGATFAIIMQPKFVDPSGKGLLFGEADELSENETTSFSKEGRDLWIARNWDAIRTKGFTGNLKAETGVDVGEVFVLVVLPIVVVGAAIFAASECEKWVSQKDKDGNVTLVCELK